MRYNGIMKDCITPCVCCALAVSSALAQCPPQRLLPPEHPAPISSFGARLEMNGRHLLIADAQAATLCGGSSGCASGAVYAHEFKDGAWVRTQAIVPPDVWWADAYGIDLDLDGDTLIVGSYNATALTGISAGGAYVYDYDGEGWVETARFVPPEPVGRSGFGRTVQLDDGVALVTQRQGVYVFAEDAGGWSWVQKLTPPDGVPLDAYFGNAMELTDEWLFIGAPFDDSLVPNGGSVYVYRRDGAEFTFTQKINPADPSISPSLGVALAYDGVSLFASGYIADGVFEGEGAVYRYEFDGNQWMLAEDITSDPRVRRAGFGSSLDVLGDTLVVGADLERIIGSPMVGAAYLFDRQPDDRWQQTHRLTPGRPTSQFGTAVAVHESRVVVGASDEREGDRVPGAAHAYDLACLACPADMDADGVLTVFDFLMFFNAFDAGDLMIADFDGDGELTIFDFLAFQTAFDAGCG